MDDGMCSQIKPATGAHAALQLSKAHGVKAGLEGQALVASGVFLLKGIRTAGIS
jgi:hypothetical protein